MKFIVDELPKSCKDCEFGKVKNLTFLKDECWCRILEYYVIDHNLHEHTAENCPLKSIKDYIKENV